MFLGPEHILISRFYCTNIKVTTHYTSKCWHKSQILIQPSCSPKVSQVIFTEQGPIAVMSARLSETSNDSVQPIFYECTWRVQPSPTSHRQDLTDACLGIASTSELRILIYIAYNYSSRVLFRFCVCKLYPRTAMSSNNDEIPYNPTWLLVRIPFSP